MRFLRRSLSDISPLGVSFNIFPYGRFQGVSLLKESLEHFPLNALFCNVFTIQVSLITRFPLNVFPSEFLFERFPFRSPR